jgi:hypothetical protein
MGNVHQTNIGSLPKGKVGQLYGDPFHYVEESFGISEGRASEESTLVIDTATNSETYGFNIFGESVTYTADGSTSKDEITAGLKAAAELNPVITGVCTIVDDTTDTLTFTARYPGIDLAIETDENAAKMTLTQTTDESEGTAIPFGRAVLLDSTDESKVVSFTAPSARVVTLTPTINTNTGVDFQVLIDIAGETYGATYDGDGSATVAEVVTGLAVALNAALPANTVVATEDDSVLTLTGEVPGQPFKVTATANLDNTFAKAVTEEGDNLSRLCGITRYTYEEAAITIGDASSVGYQPGRDAIVLKKGRIYVEAGNSATRTSDVYIGTASAERGRIFDADGTGRLKVTDGSLRWHKANVIDIDLR